MRPLFPGVRTTTRRTPRILMRVLLIALMRRGDLARGLCTSRCTFSRARRHALADTLANPSSDEKPTKGKTPRRRYSGCRTDDVYRYLGPYTPYVAPCVFARHPNSAHLCPVTVLPHSVSFFQYIRVCKKLTGNLTDATAA